MRALTDPLFDGLGIGAHLDDAALVAAMLAFERALAEAEEEAGLIPAGTAAAIAAACRPEAFDPEALGQAARDGGNPAIPLVAALRREVARTHPEAAAWVHHGATSQDVWDSALNLCARRALAAILDELQRLLAAFARLIRRHRETLRPARTLLRHALPTSLALELALVADGLLRVRQRLTQATREDLALQLGGAAGTRALLGARAEAVVAGVAHRLGLAPALPWHTVRDRRQHLASLLVELAALAAKWLRDVALAGQDELGELQEPAASGRGHSSALPHKRNPIAATRALAAFHQLPGLLATLHAAALQEFARGLGGWHAEWQPLTHILTLTGSILHEARTVADGLVADAGRMVANLELGQGRIFAEALQAALLPALGAEARPRVEALCQRSAAEGVSLLELALADGAIRKALGREELLRVFDPKAQLVAASAMVDAVLARLSPDEGAG